MLAAVTSSEITLKGRNRGFFETILKKNLQASLGQATVSKKGTSRFLISVNADEEEVRGSLEKVFGVDTISFPAEVPLDIRKIEETALSYGITNKSIRVHTRRSSKKFSMTSAQVNNVIGKALVDSGCTVDLDNPDETVFIDILDKSALISTGKTKGPGGLPVGSSGKVLSLLSGGIDSPVASWLMMKRGCTVDFLHMHSFKSNKDVRKSKIMEIAEKLREYSPRKMRIFAVPYTEFYKKTLSTDSKKEMVIFRRFLLRLANRIARRKKHKGIVMGDSIGQVASQTLDNIMAANDASHLPVFRPLVSFNKNEIVDLAVKIGTYEASIKEYKDCCSLVAGTGATNLGLRTVKKIEEEMNIEELADRTLGLCEIIEV